MVLEGPGLALRGLFTIDPSGVIEHLSVSDLPVGQSVEDTLHPVDIPVCGSPWRRLLSKLDPDSPTIRPHLTASTEQSEKVNQYVIPRAPTALKRTAVGTRF